LSEIFPCELLCKPAVYSFSYWCKSDKPQALPYHNGEPIKNYTHVVSGPTGSWYQHIFTYEVNDEIVVMFDWDKEVVQDKIHAELLYPQVSYEPWDHRRPPTPYEPKVDKRPMWVQKKD
jgi:hypothetical protein